MVVSEELSGLQEELKRSGHCVTLEQLAVKGRDLKELRGPAVGEALRRMLEHVLDHPEDNSKEWQLDVH